MCDREDIASATSRNWTSRWLTTPVAFMLTRVTEPGAVLRRTRVEAGLSIRALASVAGVSASTISRIEAGTMDPTVGMLGRLLISAGARMDLTVRPVVHIAALSDAWHSSSRGDVINWTRLRAFTDYLAHNPLEGRSALRVMPEPSGSPLLDNLLAGIAETESDRLGIASPEWPARVPALIEPWVSPGTPRMQASARKTTPAALAARGLTVSASSIWRESANAYRSHTAKR